MKPNKKQNILLEIAYDGTSYFGWQKNNHCPSIEKTLESSLSQILQEKISLQAASRTDRGVHALSQIVNFFTEKNIDNNKLLSSCNKLLPKDIIIKKVKKMPFHFHPSTCSIAKEYLYFISNASYQLPLQRHFAWHFYYPIDLISMKTASHLFVGKKDFSSFCSGKEKRNSRVRTIFSLDIFLLENDLLQITIKGDYFLHKMIRNIVSALAYVGAHKLSYQKIKNRFTATEKKNITAPAHALFLSKIFYPKDFLL